MQSNLAFGVEAENFTKAYLESQNFKILKRNYRQFFGEIDIIAQKEETIIFVEVKSRRSNFSSIFEAVTLSKQKKIIATALKYIFENSLTEKILRFDVSLIRADEFNRLKLDYIENAFSEVIY